MGVPGAGGTLAVEDLDESDPSLAQPAGRQELLSERPRDVVVQPVEPSGRFVLVAEAQDLGDCGLHVEGQLVRLDAGAQLGIVWILLGREPVQSTEEVGLDHALGLADGYARAGEGQGVVRVDFEQDSRMLGAEVVGIDAPHALGFQCRSHRDELRQLIAEGPEPVVDPGADGRITAVEQVAAGEEFHLRAVIVVGGEHRPNHGDVVDAASQVGPPVADRSPALSAFSEPDLRRIDPGLLLVDDVIGDLFPDILEERRVEDRRLVGGLADHLARMAVERGFGVEALQVADASSHHQPDDAPGPGRVMRTAVGGSPTGCIVRTREPVSMQHRAQCKTQETHARVRQERPSRAHGRLSRRGAKGSISRRDARKTRRDAEKNGENKS